MAFCPHFNTQKKTSGEPKPIRCTPKGISMRAEKESIWPPKKVISSKKNHSVRKKKPFRLPFCVSDSHRTLSPDVVIIPPTRIQEGHFPACNNWFPRVEPFFCRDFLGFLFVLPILEPSFFFVAGAACIGNRLYLQCFIFCAQSADRDRICALFSTLTPNLSLFTAFSASNGEQPAECLRLFQVILIDVSRETRIFLAIFSIIRAVHYSS